MKSSNKDNLNDSIVSSQKPSASSPVETDCDKTLENAEPDVITTAQTQQAAKHRIMYDRDYSSTGKVISVEEEDTFEIQDYTPEEPIESMSDYTIEGSVLADERIDDNIPYESVSASVKRVGYIEKDKDSNTREKTGFLYSVLDTVRFIALGLIIGILLIVFVIQRNDVYGNSMQPTLNDGDAVFVEMISKYTSSFERGDIVTINAEGIPGFFSEEKMIIKRVIGAPGDTILISEGKVYLNGQLLDEPYLLEGTETTVRNEGIQSGYDNITLGENEFYCMGDYRGVSNDSRRLGPIHMDRIKAKVLVKVFPFSDFKFLP